MSNCVGFCLDSGTGSNPLMSQIPMEQSQSKKRKNVDEDKKKELDKILKNLGLGVPMF